MDLLKQYKEQRPAVVFEWSDTETEAEGWVVINSLRGGAAGGGTRMRDGLDKKEVVSLAKVMEIKFTVSGPSIGGAKSGINFDPNDPRKEEVMQRWFKAVYPLLKHYYGTGGDLNIDEVKDVIPVTEDLGLWHPQEGIVNGHFTPRESQKIQMIGQLRTGVSKKVEDPRYSPDHNSKYVVADLITGYGVAESVRHYYRIYHNSGVHGKRAIIQGFGNVAATAAYYLTQNGARIVGIIDKVGGIINEEGLGEAELRELMYARKGNSIQADQLIPFEELNEKIWDVPAEIFIPGAASRLVDRSQVEKLISSGLEVISSGANVPFRDDDVFFGDTASYTDQRVSVIPDFIANCGMARTFAYLMQDKDVEISDEAIFSDVSNCIGIALQNIHNEHPEATNIAKNALQHALQKLV